LEPLATTNIPLKHHVIAGSGLKPSSVNWVGRKRELLTRSARHFHQMRLIGISETRADQQFTALRMPVRRKRGASLSIAPGGLGESGGNRWHTLRDNRFRRRNRRWLLSSNKSCDYKNEYEAHKMSSHRVLLESKIGLFLTPASIRHASVEYPLDAVERVIESRKLQTIPLCSRKS
jgi:hypothetical protein